MLVDVNLKKMLKCRRQRELARGLLLEGVFKMKSNLKVKNINTKIIKNPKEGGALPKKATEKFKLIEKIPEVEKAPPFVSFRMVSKIKLCFRECASIVKIASDTACLIEIASGTKEGTSDSILSLVNLAVTAGQSLLLKIHGENNRDAFSRISKILSGELEADVELELS